MIDYFSSPFFLCAGKDHVIIRPALTLSVLYAKES